MKSKVILILILCSLLCSCSTADTKVSQKAPANEQDYESKAVILPVSTEQAHSELPLITLTENLLTSEKGVWPPFSETPEATPKPHPFDGHAAYNAFFADLNCDGAYEAYATISLGSGMVTSYLLGYDSITRNTYTLNERLIVEYDFIAYNGELFVFAGPSFYTFSLKAVEETPGVIISPPPPEGNPDGYYRPVLNNETLTFDLEQIPESLAEEIYNALYNIS
jgi:hypothetical protein